MRDAPIEESSLTGTKRSVRAHATNVKPDTKMVLPAVAKRLAHAL